MGVICASPCISLFTLLIYSYTAYLFHWAFSVLTAVFKIWFDGPDIHAMSDYGSDACSSN